MKEVDDLYSRLEIRVQRLDEEFIRPYIPTDASQQYPSAHEYGCSVQAYCVLCHAALEDFMEQVALKVVDRAVDEWTYQRKTTDAVLALLCHTGRTHRVSESKELIDLKVIDYLRPLVDEAKRIFGEEVKSNNGVSIKYIRRLMIPAGIEIPTDGTWHDSLKQLTQERGSYAHKNAVTTVLSPEDARRHVENCLLLCQSVKSKVDQQYPTG